MSEIMTLQIVDYSIPVYTIVPLCISQQTEMGTFSTF